MYNMSCMRAVQTLRCVQRRKTPLFSSASLHSRDNLNPSWSRGPSFKSTDQKIHSRGYSSATEQQAAESAVAPDYLDENELAIFETLKAALSPTALEVHIQPRLSTGPN